MKKLSILLIIGVLASCSPKLKKASSDRQNSSHSYKISTIAFYNLENLFDTINDPDKNDEASPLMENPKEARGKIYKKKVSNMARAISKIGTKKAKNSPAVLGVAEVENRAVLEDLVNDPQLKDKHYGIIHYDSPDKRGIDVGLLYQKALFTPLSSSTHEVVIYDLDNKDKRHYTRDVLLVDGVLDGDTIHVLVNHWPSRYGGEKRSRPNREKAAGVNKKIVDSLQNVDPYAKVFIMGDLNDGPYNTSVKKVLGAKAEKDQVGKFGLYNPMENMLKKRGLGTIGYRDSWDIFDQIIMTKPLLKKDYSSYRLFKAGIFNPNFLTTQNGRYKGYPFRSFVGSTWKGGYSDHFPVYVYLIKEIPQ